MIAIKYAIFAVISTLLNLFSQYFSFFIYSGAASLYVAMFFGTLSGLVCKYILDKNYIFYHKPKNKVDDAKKFILYSLVGVLTTGIFWGTEIVFDAVFSGEKIKYVRSYFGVDLEAFKYINSENAKYIGAIIGLSIGYVSKYFLDKKFVFKDIS